MALNLNPFSKLTIHWCRSPWGPMEAGDPGDMPGAPKERNLDDFKAFDQSEIVKNLITNLRAGQGRQEMQTQRRFARLGAGNSDAARNALQEVAANTETRAGDVQLQAAKEAWADRMRQKEFAEQMDLKRYENALKAWAAQKQLYAGEEAQRKNTLTGIVNNLQQVLSDVNQS